MLKKISLSSVAMTNVHQDRCWINQFYLFIILFNQLNKNEGSTLQGPRTIHGLV